MTLFNAFWVEKTEGGYTQSVVERSIDDLSEGEVLIKVSYSSLNYKDALSAKGMPGVTRSYPHTPGIDAAGQVVSSTNPAYKEGDSVICIGFDLGMDTPGGFGEYVRVPADWLSPLPAGLTLRESMILGTAGFTAALCLEKLERMGALPKDGPVFVTGATGGVGSVAVALFAKIGFEVTAITGKPGSSDYLESLGVSKIVMREELEHNNSKPLLAAAYAHGIDTVGGNILSNLIKSLSYGGSIAVCGLVASPKIEASVLPFILRGINVLGVDSVNLPITKKTETWAKLASEWKLDTLSDIAQEIELEQVSKAIEDVFSGKNLGRIVIAHK
ncbi:MAG: acryloyl-CoA reductase [Gammaproteobacteria bacterium TMED1]|nr:MAG: acryloyl-CoA reductase [Gammaproteobacteria bacterium TMED1]